MRTYIHTYMLRIPAILVILSAIAFCAAPAWGKVKIEGRVIDSSLDGVAGAMVKGKIGKKIEAYALTGEDGEYLLSVPDSMMKSGTVEISSMGFAPRTFTLAELAKNPVVELTREVTQLEEFTIKEKGTKVKRPGWLANATIY